MDNNSTVDKGGFILIEFFYNFSKNKVNMTLQRYSAVVDIIERFEGKVITPKEFSSHFCNSSTKKISLITFGLRISG